MVQKEIRIMKYTKQIRQEYEYYKKWQREFKFVTKRINTSRLSLKDFTEAFSGFKKWNPNVKITESTIKEWITKNTNYVSNEYLHKMAKFFGMGIGAFIKKWMKMGAAARKALIHEYIVGTGGDTEGYESEEDFENSDFDDLDELVKE